MGRITVSERVCTILKMPLFHAWGVMPTWVEMSPTLSFTLSNIPLRLLRIPLTSSSFSQSVRASHTKPIGVYLLFRPSRLRGRGMG